MIYGPYSTGWRDEENARARVYARRWAWVGVAVVLASAGLVVRALGVWL